MNTTDTAVSIAALATELRDQLAWHVEHEAAATGAEELRYNVPTGVDTVSFTVQVQVDGMGEPGQHRYTIRVVGEQADAALIAHRVARYLRDTYRAWNAPEEAEVHTYACRPATRTAGCGEVSIKLTADDADELRADDLLDCPCGHPLTRVDY